MSEDLSAILKIAEMRFRAKEENALGSFFCIGSCAGEVDYGILTKFNNVIYLHHTSKLYEYAEGTSNRLNVIDVQKIYHNGVGYYDRALIIREACKYGYTPSTYEMFNIDIPYGLQKGSGFELRWGMLDELIGQLEREGDVECAINMAKELNGRVDAILLLEELVCDKLVELYDDIEPIFEESDDLRRAVNASTNHHIFLNPSDK